jgi:hypothetical protein
MVAAHATAHAVRMLDAITPETELERALLADPRLRAGLDWGAPRPGHPEGRVADHVAAILAAIAADERLLAALELHDEPYWIWRHADTPEPALQSLLGRVPDLGLFAHFVELDAANEGKDLTFLWWFRRELAITGRLPTHPATGPDGDAGDVVYVKAFATEPHQQPAIAHAARELVAEQRGRMGAEGEVLTSDDGLRVWLVWRWHGSRRELIERDADVVREALAAHPIFAQARAVEARILRAAKAA